MFFLAVPYYCSTGSEPSNHDATNYPSDALIVSVNNTEESEIMAMMSDGEGVEFDEPIEINIQFTPEPRQSKKRFSLYAVNAAWARLIDDYTSETGVCSLFSY